jgi:hypothetical protein
MLSVASSSLRWLPRTVHMPCMLNAPRTQVRDLPMCTPSITRRSINVSPSAAFTVSTSSAAASEVQRCFVFFSRSSCDLFSSCVQRSCYWSLKSPLSLSLDRIARTHSCAGSSTQRNGYEPGAEHCHRRLALQSVSAFRHQTPPLHVA